VLSLGCQSAQIATLLQEIRRRNPAFSKPLFIWISSKAAPNSPCFRKPCGKPSWA
jgi:hypothetical protein